MMGPMGVGDRQFGYADGSGMAGIGGSPALPRYGGPRMGNMNPVQMSYGGNEFSNNQFRLPVSGFRL
jgi:hypothetical protein